MYQEHICVFALTAVVLQLKFEALGGPRHTSVEADIMAAHIAHLPSHSHPSPSTQKTSLPLIHLKASHAQLPLEHKTKRDGNS